MISIRKVHLNLRYLFPHEYKHFTSLDQKNPPFLPNARFAPSLKEKSGAVGSNFLDWYWHFLLSIVIFLAGELNFIDFSAELFYEKYAIKKFTGPFPVHRTNILDNQSSFKNGP